MAIKLFTESSYLSPTSEYAIMEKAIKK